MKLANPFLITALVSVLAAIGCSDDPAPQNGTGGTGGGGADPCTGDFCDLPEPKAACEAAINFCNTDPEVDLTPEECDAAGSKFCQIDFSGTGGTGGSTPAGNCDYGDCAEPGTERDACENAVRICENTPNLPPAVEEVCIEGANLDACGPR